MNFERISSAYGSIAINLILGTLLFAELSCNWCGDLACRGGYLVRGVELRLRQDPWTPWIDTPRQDGVPTGDKGPHCPPPLPRADAVHLDEAPLPTGYDPLGVHVGRLIACVKLDHRARVVSAYLLPGDRPRPLDAAVLREISREWRFRRTDVDPAGWQRVRLYEELVASSPVAIICGQLDWSRPDQGCKLAPTRPPPPPP